MVLLKTLAVVVGLIAIAFAGLGIRIWIKGRFPDTEVETNPNMMELGLKCAKQEEWEAHCAATGNSEAGLGCSACCSSCGDKS